RRGRALAAHAAGDSRGPSPSRPDQRGVAGHRDLPLVLRPHAVAARGACHLASRRAVLAPAVLRRLPALVAGPRAHGRDGLTRPQFLREIMSAMSPTSRMFSAESMSSSG